MTTLAPPREIEALGADGTPGADLRSFPRRLARVSIGDVLAARLALLMVSAFAAGLYLWNLTVSGYANEYYSAAAQAAATSWKAFFFCSLDAANFITIDKPPLATWLMGLSVRLFGLSSWSILLPQALLGVATVALLFLIVRRAFGTVAAFIAGIAMALTPAAVLIFRYDNPDALLTFLLVASAGALLRAAETGRLRWLAVAGLLVGLAFNTKYMQAYLVVPGFAVTYLIAGAGSLRRRLGGVVVLGVTTLLASAWWVAIVELLPTASRPYIGGSNTNSALELLLGYDGLSRIFGFFGLDRAAGPAGGGAGVGGGGGGAGFGGAAGILRLLNDQFAGQTAWLIPFALAALLGGLWIHRRASRTDAARAAYLLWGSWLLVTAAVFSLMGGIIHSYYAVALAPAIAALVGAGAVELWRFRRDSRAGGLLLATGILCSGALSAAILWRTPAFAPGLGVSILVVAGGAAAFLAFPMARRARRLSMVAASLALVALLAGPAAYAADTIASAHAGGDPSAGPVSARNQAAFAGGPAGGPGGIQGGSQPRAGFSGEGLAAGGPPMGEPPAGSAPTGEPPSGSSGAGGSSLGSPTGAPGGAANAALVAFLKNHQGTATWIVAVVSANEAAPIQLASGRPVMAMGGFSGSDPAPTLEQLKSYVASGQLRYMLLNGGGNGGGPGGSSAGVAATRDAWVTSTCKVVDSGGSGSGGTLYDCAGAV
jgi:4-amino-4-deoxy-L-arabinose transferase-like glycosyltransferase